MYSRPVPIPYLLFSAIEEVYDRKIEIYSADGGDLTPMITDFDAATVSVLTKNCVILLILRFSNPVFVAL